MSKYALYCNQRYIYYGGLDIEDTSHFNSLEEIKETLIDYHQDIEEEEHKLLYKMEAVEIANMFDWSIEKIKESK
tara:strand:+ start:178 stop:402 length:225 start_codon:yes stop_codon:yes gene_type:complete